MTTLDDLRDVFRASLDLDESSEVDGLTYRGIEAWDSVAHMALVAELEDRFDVMFETEQIIDLSSFAKAIELLAVHGVEFS